MKSPYQSPITASLVAQDDHAAFLQLYLRHPGGAKLTRQDLAAETCIGILARDGRNRPVGALALRLLPGRRASCYFPILQGSKRLRAECGAALGELAAEIARRAGARYLECQFEQGRRKEAFEELPRAILLPFVTRHLLMRREVEKPTNRLFESEPATVDTLLEVMAGCYEHSADPSLQSMLPKDDLANMLGGTGETDIRRLPGPSVKGAALLRRTGDAGEVVFMGVPPRYQRQGNGHRLLLACLVRLAQEGCRLVDLAVAEENLPALALYRSQGFRKRSEALLFRRPIDNCEKSTAASIMLLE